MLLKFKLVKPAREYCDRGKYTKRKRNKQEVRGGENRKQKRTS